MDQLVVDFAWTGVPADWLIVSSFGEGKTQRTRTTLNEFLEGVIVAGRFRAYTVNAYGRPIRVIIRGHGAFPDSALVAPHATSQHVNARSGMTARRGTISSPHCPAIGGTGGTAFTHALVMYSDTTTPLFGFAGLLSHEMFHEWNGHAMRTAGPEGGMKWLSEGFTDFFADRFSRDVGFLSPEGYVDRVNNAIRNYYVSPVRNSTRDDVNRSYWSSADMNRFPYAQGYLIAAFLDGELRSASKNAFTIDSLLFSVFRRARASGKLVDDSMFTDAVPLALRAAVRDSVRSFVVAAIRSRLQRVSSATAWTSAPISSFPSTSASMRVHRRATESFGAFAREARQTPRALRDGMTLRGWSWFNGDPTSRPLYASPRATRFARSNGRRVRDRAVSVPQLSLRTDCKP
jgi:predicted metalloprotease with PDZ domain